MSPLRCLLVLGLAVSLARSHYLPGPSSADNAISSLWYEEDELTAEAEQKAFEASHASDFVPEVLSSMFDLLNVRQVLVDLRGGKVNTATCIACKLGMSILQHYVQSGRSEDEIAHIAAFLCKTLHIETPRVCVGVTRVFKSEMVQVFSNIALSPKEICGLLLGDKCAVVENPFHNWTIDFPPIPKPPVQPIVPPKAGAPVIKVLHLSDTHFDPYYKEGNNAECGEPLCCRIQDGPAPHPSMAAGKWGDYRNCDSPLRTLEHMLKHIAKSHKVDYVLWTGDIPPHNIWNTSRKHNIEILHSVSQLINKYLGSVPIFPALGNHESSPVNSFPPPQIQGKFSISWLYNELAKAWKDWLPQNVMPTLKKGAFYSIVVQPGFKIISINTNYCNTGNWWLLLNTTDPAGQLEWLVNELQLSEILGEKVHIIGHIPPGTPDCFQIWSKNFYKIIDRYESTVTAQFYGHTHMDEFEMFYDEESKKRPTNIAYIGPSVTTYEGVNPGYRIYTIDGNYKTSTRMVLDHETYILNITEANRTDKPIWRLEYSAKQDLGMSSLLPAQWDKLIYRMQNDDDLFQKFYRYYTKQSDFLKKTCDAECKTELLCRLRSGQPHDKDLCPSGF